MYTVSKKKGGVHVSECGHEHKAKHFCPFTSTGAILVLFILLVIIIKACWV
ncbi:YjcZ family sporulation protein [Paenibacillus farraposensis]|uniref:YjcZ family sporulation protein n=1 Tax=Paenibacillus farraposensis TaxID=2807095 RepID=UPI003611412E